MGHREPVTGENTMIPIIHDHGTPCCRTSSSWSVLMSLVTSAPLIWFQEKTRTKISSKRCRFTDEGLSDCNTVSSETFSMFSLIGSTMWVLFKVAVVFPKEWGKNLKFSAYT